MSLSSILGQDAAVSVLRRLLELKIRPSFFLFTGMPGVGKKKAAWEYAKALLCPKASPEGACEACDGCMQASKGAHADITVVDFAYQAALAGAKSSAASLKVDTMREAIRLAALRPYGDRVSVCIVDGAEALTTQAQNAALKILEESPGYLTWVWLAQSEEMILPTILSRASMRLRFKPLDADTVIRLAISELGAGEAQARAAAERGAVSMEQAKRMLERTQGSGAEWARTPASPAEIFQLSQRAARFKSYAHSRKVILELFEDLKIQWMSDWRLKGDSRALLRVRKILKAQQDLENNLTPPLVLEHLFLDLI